MKNRKPQQSIRSKQLNNQNRNGLVGYYEMGNQLFGCHQTKFGVRQEVIPAEKIIEGHYQSYDGNLRYYQTEDGGFEMIDFSTQPESSPLSIENDLPPIDEQYFFCYLLSKLVCQDPYATIIFIENVAAELESKMTRAFYIKILESLHSLNYQTPQSKTLIDLVKMNLNQKVGSFQSEVKQTELLTLPTWDGTPSEFIEWVTVGLYLNKFGEMKKYKALNRLIEAFNVPIDSSGKINGQRLYKLINRKISPHPLIDQYIKEVADLKKRTEVIGKFKRGLKNE